MLWYSRLGKIKTATEYSDFWMDIRAVSQTQRWNDSKQKVEKVLRDGVFHAKLAGVDDRDAFVL